MTAADDRVILGRISGVFGVKGWVKVWSFTDPVEGILEYPVWQLKLPDGWEERKVLAGQRQGKGLVVQIADCEDRDQARRLVQAEIAVTRSALPELPEGEYYWRDLEGLRVMAMRADAPPVFIGVVDHLMTTGANDVLVVKPVEGSVDGRERLVPWVQDRVVVGVDLAGRELRVDWDPDF